MSTSVTVTCDGMRNARDDGQRAAGLVGVAGEDDALPHVGAEQIEALVAVEVHQAHVRHRRRGRHVRHGHGLARELKRRLAGRRPAFRQRQALGRAAREVRQHRGQVWRQVDAAERAGRPDRRQPVLANEIHADEFVAPGAARQDVGRRQRVAHAAGRARMRFVGLRRVGRLGLARRVDRRRHAPENGDDQEPEAGGHEGGPSGARHLPGC